MSNSGNNFVSAEPGFEKEEKAVRYTDANGNIVVRKGGARAWRNNNPGNIICSPYANDHGAIGCDAESFAIFPDWETGKEAMETLLREGWRYKNNTIEGAIREYTDDPAEVEESYINHVTSETGMPRTKRINEMTEEEYQSFIRAMREQEDSTPSKEILKYVSGDEVSYSERGYIKLGDGSPKDFSNYGPDIPRKYEGFIEFTPAGFKTKRGIPVESSNVNNIGYDESTRILEVGFDDGSIYHYSSVPTDVFERFLYAPSKGKFLHREIMGAYDYSRVN
ncbi:MAG: KTSC domain-containing protein [Nitrospinota bacterium]